MSSDTAAVERLPMPEFIEDVLAALSANNASELQGFVEKARGVEAPKDEKARQAALSRLRFLASVLDGTGRNLRLMHRMLGLHPSAQLNSGRELYRRTNS